MIRLAMRLAVVGAIAGAVMARAAESDEVLDLQRLADEEMLAPAAEAAAPEAIPATPAPAAVAPDSSSQVRALQIELERARDQIARLERALQDQEARHQAELQSSFYNMGCVYKAAKQYERAEAEFLKVLAINPNDAAVHYNLGVLYDDDLNQKAKAKAHYKKFLELAPDDRDVALVQEWLAELE